jgi:hypothetical protein
VRLKLNGTHQLLAYAHVVTLLGHNIDAIKINTKKNKQTNSVALSPRANYTD